MGIAKPINAQNKTMNPRTHYDRLYYKIHIKDSP